MLDPRTAFLHPIIIAALKFIVTSGDVAALFTPLPLPKDQI